MLIMHSLVNLKTSCLLQKSVFWAATGVKNMIRYAKFFKNKFVKGFMAIDSDSDGRSVKKRFESDEPEISDNVFEIKDIIDSKKNEMTLEDLFPEDVIKQAVKAVHEKDISLDDGRPVVDQIKTMGKKRSH